MLGAVLYPRYAALGRREARSATRQAVALCSTLRPSCRSFKRTVCRVTGIPCRATPSRPPRRSAYAVPCRATSPAADCPSASHVASKAAGLVGSVLDDQNSAVLTGRIPELIASELARQIANELVDRMGDEESDRDAADWLVGVTARPSAGRCHWGACVARPCRPLCRSAGCLDRVQEPAAAADIERPPYRGRYEVRHVGAKRRSARDVYPARWCHRAQEAGLGQRH
jgi:hypothetical protein